MAMAHHRYKRGDETEPLYDRATRIEIEPEEEYRHGYYADVVEVESLEAAIEEINCGSAIVDESNRPEYEYKVTIFNDYL